MLWKNNLYALCIHKCFARNTLKEETTLDCLGVNGRKYLSEYQHFQTKLIILFSPPFPPTSNNIFPVIPLNFISFLSL
jgi:hypothetical protein